MARSWESDGEPPPGGDRLAPLWVVDGRIGSAPTRRRQPHIAGGSCPRQGFPFLRFPRAGTRRRGSGPRTPPPTPWSDERTTTPPGRASRLTPVRPRPSLTGANRPDPAAHRTTPSRRGSGAADTTVESGCSPSPSRSEGDRPVRTGQPTPRLRRLKSLRRLTSRTRSRSSGRRSRPGPGGAVTHAPPSGDAPRSAASSPPAASSSVLRVRHTPVEPSGGGMLAALLVSWSTIREPPPRGRRMPPPGGSAPTWWLTS